MKSRRFLKMFVLALVCIAPAACLSAAEKPPEATPPAATEKAAPPADPFIAPVDAAMEKGLAYLESAINKDDGSYGAMFPDKETGKDKYIPDVGITGLVVTAVAQSPFREREMKKEYFQKALKYILSNVQPDGSITNKGQGLENYRTSIAITALNAVDAKQYADTIKKAQTFVKSLQFAPNKENPGYEGGIGYGGSMARPDLSNTQTALEALRESGIPANDEVIQKSIKFLQRCQNSTDTNDYDKTQPDLVPVNDGGARYSPYESKVSPNAPEGKKMFPSYGSMTYAFLKSMLYAGVDRNDPRVRAAFHWILVNYNLDTNPGFTIEVEKNADQQGLYYYYHTMSKALLIYSSHALKTPDGKLHNWAMELSSKLISLQGKDGSWMNSSASRWYEGNPSLVTAYSIAVLNNCRQELRNQAEFLKTAPVKIAEAQKQMAELTAKIADGTIKKEEGEKNLAELQQTAASLKEGLENLQKTREIKNETKPEPSKDAKEQK
jgi:squalene-hopene/tetraprenyl-beta-curcumene cyclase